MQCINKECSQYKDGPCPNECSCRIEHAAVTNHMNAVREIKGEEPINHEEEYTELKKGKEFMKKEINNSYARIDEKSKRIDVLEEQLKNANITIIGKETLQKENDKLKTDIKGLEDKIETIDDEYQVEITELKERLKKFKTIESELQRWKDSDKTYEWVEQGAELKKIKEENKHLNERINKYQDSISEKQTTIEELTYKTIDLQNEKTALKHDLTTLEDREADTKEKLENYKLLKRMINILVEGL